VGITGTEGSRREVDMGLGSKRAWRVERGMGLDRILEGVG
jgi:hypothetical protein